VVLGGSGIIVVVLGGSGIIVVVLGGSGIIVVVLGGSVGRETQPAFSGKSHCVIR